jgi:hypothetical protein
MTEQEDSLARTLGEAETTVLADLQHALAGPLDLMVERELAIVRRLQQRHARMAADMVQHGLFDRRTERAAAAQSALLEKALAQASERLRMLTGFKAARSGGYELAFAIDVF